MEISTITIEGHNSEANIIQRFPNQPITLLKIKIALLEVDKGKEYDLHLKVFSSADHLPIFNDTYSINQKEFKFNDEEHLYNNVYALSFVTNLPIYITKTGLYFIEVSFSDEGIIKEQRMSFFVK